MKSLIIILLISFILPANSQYFGSRIEPNKDRAISPVFIIFREATMKPVHIEYIMLNDTKDFNYYVSGDDYYSVGRNFADGSFVIDVYKYKIKRDTIVRTGHLNLGKYENEIETEFSKNNLTINRQDSVFIIDLNKFKLISKQKKFN